MEPEFYLDHVQAIWGGEERGNRSGTLWLFPKQTLRFQNSKIGETFSNGPATLGQR